MPSEPDTRLYFVRNQEELASGHSEYVDVEYEVVADAHIVGDIDYGPYNFTIWEMSTTRHVIEPEGNERKLCLRVRNVAASDDAPSLRDSATRKGFYHGGGIPEELVTLASLFLRRRFQLGPVVRIDDKPRMWSPRGPGWIDHPLVMGQSNLEDLSELLPLAEGLRPDLHQKFILAVRLYSRALILMEEEPDLAYLNLVSAVEVLCQDTEVGEVTFDDLGMTKMARLLNQVEDEELRQELERAILARERLIKRRFVRFILDHVEESFWTDDGRWPEEARHEHGRVERDDLENRLKKIYDQRSDTLHKGEPFPPYVFDTHRWREELPTGLSMRSGERQWMGKDFIPNPLFFERLINHVLMSFLRRNQISPSS